MQVGGRGGGGEGGGRGGGGGETFAAFVQLSGGITGVGGKVGELVGRWVGRGVDRCSKRRWVVRRLWLVVEGSKKEQKKLNVLKHLFESMSLKSARYLSRCLRHASGR